MIKKIFAGVLTLLAFTSYSQTTTPSTRPDSLTNFTFANDDSSTQAGGEATPVSKPYVRLKLNNIDTITNLVTYKEVVEQEESQEDSLYIRCLKMIKRRFDIYGKMIPVNKKNEKIQLTLRLPIYTKPNSFTKTPAGNIDFLFTLDIKAGRYRYRIDNIRHLPPPNSLNPEPKPVYLEYYLEAKANVKGTDLIVKGADEEIKRFISDLKKQLKDPRQADDEDW